VSKPREQLRDANPNDFTADFMKKMAKRLMKTFAHGLPMRVQWAMMEQFSIDLCPWNVFGHVAPQCGISSVRVAGAYGTIQSAPTDRVILRAYADTGYWAKGTNDTLIAFFLQSGGGRYIDIGANIGLTTIPVAQNPKVHCLAVEPEPTNFSNLTINVEVNCPHRNVQLRQLAVFSRRDILKFEIATSGNLGDHRIRLQDKPGRLGEHTWTTINVEAVPLDDIVDATEGPLAVKMDTQGAEPFIVEGGRKILAEADLLICEWAPYWMSRLGGDPATITDFLRKHFRLISMTSGEDNSVSTSEPVDIATEELLEIAHKHRDDPRQYFEIVGRK